MGFIHLLFWTPLFATLGICLSFFIRSGRPVTWVAKVWSNILLFVSGVPYTVHGLENLDSQKQYVFISNHESAFDIFLIFAALPYHLVFISKIELRNIPFLGWAMILGRYIFVDRKNHKSALASMNRAGKSLNRFPRSIIVFPEGTRSHDGRIRPFKKGGIILAIETKLDLVPIAVCGTMDVMEKGKMKITPQRVNLFVGEPIETKNLNFEDRNRIAEILRKDVVNLKSLWK